MPACKTVTAAKNHLSAIWLSLFLLILSCLCIIVSRLSTNLVRKFASFSRPLIDFNFFLPWKICNFRERSPHGSKIATLDRKGFEIINVLCLKNCLKTKAWHAIMLSTLPKVHLVYPHFIHTLSTVLQPPGSSP